MAGSEVFMCGDIQAEADQPLGGNAVVVEWAGPTLRMEEPASWSIKSSPLHAYESMKSNLPVLPGMGHHKSSPTHVSSLLLKFSENEADNFTPNKRTAGIGNELKKELLGQVWGLEHIPLWRSKWGPWAWKETESPMIWLGSLFYACQVRTWHW